MSEVKNVAPAKQDSTKHRDASKQAPVKQDVAKQTQAQKSKQIKDSDKSESGLSVNARQFFDAFLESDRDTKLSISGKGPSFDELESVEKTRKEVVDNKIKKTKEEESEDEEKKEKKVKNKDGDDTTDTEISKEENEAKEIEEEIKKTIKTIKTKLFDKDIDLPIDLAIPVKIDGKVQNIALQELMNNFSGKVSWDKRFSELDRERKKFISERDNLMSHFKAMQEHLQSPNPENALLYLVDLLGGDRYTFIKGLRDSLSPEIIRLYSMDESERLAYENEQRAKALEEKLKRYELDKQYMQEKSAYAAKIEQIKRNNNISDDEYLEAEEFLREKAGTNEITPEFIAKYINAYRAINRVERIVEKVSPSLLQNQELVKDVVEYVCGNDVSDEEIDGLVRELSGINNAVKVISERQENNPADKITINEKDERYIKSWDDLNY